MNSLKFLLVVALAVIAISQQSSALFPQYAQFYPINTFSGPHIYSFETVPDFQKFSNQNVLAITQRGLWTYTYIRAGVTQTSTSVDDGSRSCLIFNAGEKLLSAERILNSDLEFPEIVLFSGPTYNGTRFITNQTEYRLPQPMDVKSYAFTGIRSWTLFPNTDFTGTPICVKPNGGDTVERGYEITGEFYVQLRIGSIRLGCVGDTKPITSQDRSKPVFATSNNGNMISQSLFDSGKNEAREFVQ